MSSVHRDYTCTYHITNELKAKQENSSITRLIFNMLGWERGLIGTLKSEDAKQALYFSDGDREGKKTRC